MEAFKEAYLDFLLDRTLQNYLKIQAVVKVSREPKWKLVAAAQEVYEGWKNPF